MTPSHWYYQDTTEKRWYGSRVARTPNYSKQRNKQEIQVSFKSITIRYYIDYVHYIDGSVSTCIAVTTMKTDDDITLSHLLRNLPIRLGYDETVAGPKYLATTMSIVRNNCLSITLLH